MKIYFVRHGQRGENENFDKLTWVGREQSKRLGDYFNGLKINSVYCSPQNRAKETLKLIKSKANLPSAKISERIRQQRVPGEVGHEVMERMNFKEDTEYELDKRVQRFLESLKKNHEEENVLVLTHKKVILSSICRILNLPPTEKIFLGKVQSASISYFELDEKFKVKDFSINDTSHLARSGLDKEIAIPHTKVKLNKTNKEGINWLKSNYPLNNEIDDGKSIHFNLRF